MQCVTHFGDNFSGNFGSLYKNMGRLENPCRSHNGMGEYCYLGNNFLAPKMSFMILGRY